MCSMALLSALIQGNVELAGCPIEEGRNGMRALKPSEVDLMGKQAEGRDLPAVSINTSGTVQPTTHTPQHRPAGLSEATGGIKWHIMIADSFCRTGVFSTMLLKAYK